MRVMLGYLHSTSESGVCVCCLRMRAHCGSKFGGRTYALLVPDNADRARVMNENLKKTHTHTHTHSLRSLPSPNGWPHVTALNVMAFRVGGGGGGRNWALSLGVNDPPIASLNRVKVKCWKLSWNLWALKQNRVITAFILDDQAAASCYMNGGLYRMSCSATRYNVMLAGEDGRPCRRPAPPPAPKLWSRTCWPCGLLPGAWCSYFGLCASVLTLFGTDFNTVPTTVYCKTSFSFHYTDVSSPMGRHQALYGDQ
jgi:hypothetical protein